MTNDRNHTSYKRIGFTVFIGLAAIVGTLIYLGGMRGRDGEVLAETYYDKPVSGLSVGSVVNFRGVKVGEVRSISFVGAKYDVKDDESTRIYILMALNGGSLRKYGTTRDVIAAGLRGLVDRRGLRATVTTSGITGLSRVELDLNPPDGLPEVPAISWVPEHIYIPPKISLLDNFAVAATKVMNQVNRMDFASVWSNISATVESLARTTDEAKTLLESRQDDVERIVDDLSDTAASLKEMSRDLRRNPSLLVRERVQPRLEETE